jgi:hypothetical protein
MVSGRVNRKVPQSGIAVKKGTLSKYERVKFEAVLHKIRYEGHATEKIFHNITDSLTQMCLSILHIFGPLKASSVQYF